MTKIPFAIVGLHFGAHITAELARGGSDDIDLVAVCDMNAPLADEIAAKYGIRAFHSLDDLLADDTIPAIGLYTGPANRPDLIRKVAEAGKHIMTTKPLALDSNAAIEAIRFARDRGITVHLNSPSPTLAPEWRQIKEWQERYDLGRAVACRRDVWVRYQEKADGGWYDDPELCPVAPVFRLGIYLINDLVRFFGPADTVSVLQSRVFTGRPTADNAQFSILFADGSIASIFASFCVNDGDHYKNSITLNFDNGTIYGNVGPYRNTDVGCNMALVKKVDDLRACVAKADICGSSGLYEWDTFAKAVRGETIEDLTPEEMVAGIKIIEAMILAEKNGGIAKVAR
jgi:predicted dehydrogenase